MPFDPNLAALRFGYGLPTPAGAPDSTDAMLAALTQPDRAMADWPIPDPAEAAAQVAAILAARKASESDPAADKALREALRQLAATVLAATKAQFARALASPDGFRERLATFWADHFTVAPREGIRRFLPFALRDQAIRPHLAGNFSTLLTAVTLHPAMLIYLDQAQSVGPASRQGKRTGKGLNENLARELIELHTLGVGARYSQKDVRQMAEVLTGLAVTPEQTMTFAPKRAEPGAKTVLGRSYDGEGLRPIRAVLADLARRPETAAHLARKLAVHFVADDPDPGLIAALEAAYAETGGNLQAVYLALLTHPAAWRPQTRKARQPFDFMVAALRGLDVGAQEVTRMADGVFRRMILDPLTDMGQPYNFAPGPDGWAEEAEAWITPQGLAARITWAMEVPGRLKTPLPDPVALAKRSLGPRADDTLLRTVTRAENIREGVGLVLASPEFNRR